jgi:hypothetical protein
MIRTAADVSMYLDNTTPGKIWSKEERAAFGILGSDQDSPKRYPNAYHGSEEYLKEVKLSKAKLMDKIKDKQEELRAHKDALPWEEGYSCRV